MKYIRRDKGKHANISMLNLIDVIFVLLLFFMVTTSFNKLTHIDIALPQTSSKLPEDKQNDKVELFVLLDDRLVLSINGTSEELNLDALSEKIANLTLEQKKSIVLNADKAIDYGKVVDVITTLKDGNVENVELNIKKASNG